MGDCRRRKYTYILKAAHGDTFIPARDVSCCEIDDAVEPRLCELRVVLLMVNACVLRYRGSSTFLDT